ncbi:RrF2 family transcriptional regulator [Paludisphaera rhizosphaerae]|uniref:RrF2 family transcriptional regulator n=1 Tax=Paludisphaera rhizosphaerae TaxID=2711216 RepID=UPI0013ECD88E|nr:Rrf2 family transcriptional regulator [Paludisphaera rhizosphaerae]
MKVSAKAEYACLAVLALARQGPNAPPLRIRDISESHGIPERYLVQILLHLKGAGLVVSTRGASGGYQLAKHPESISIREILTAVDGPDDSSRETPTADRRAAQILNRLWDRVREAERAVLDQTTVAALVAQATPHEWTI